MPPILYSLKGLCENGVGPKIVESLGRSEALASVAPDTFKPRTRTATHPIRLYHTLIS
jgi:hypothetical protein